MTLNVDFGGGKYPLELENGVLNPTAGASQDKLDELIPYTDTFEFWFNIVTP